MGEPQRKEDSPSPAEVAAFICGERDAFFAIYRVHDPAVRRTVQRVFHSPFEQEEAVQEIWLAVHRNCRSYDPSRGALSAWLRTVALNRCRELLRARGRQPAADVDLDEVPDEWVSADRPGPEEAALRARMREALAQFAKTLPKEEARVLELALVEELSLEQVAQALSANVRRCKYLKKKLLARAAVDPGLRRVVEELLPKESP